MMDKLKTAVVLMVIGIISGFLIWGTNELTYDGILELRAERELAYYKEIFLLGEDATITFEENDMTGVLQTEYVIIDANDEVVGYIYKGEGTNSYGAITVLVGINLDGTIANVVISNTTNTANNVKNIELNYLGNFVGQDTADVTYDSKTGATFTYNSVAEFVEAAAVYYQANRGGDNE